MIDERVESIVTFTGTVIEVVGIDDGRVAVRVGGQHVALMSAADARFLAGVLERSAEHAESGAQDVTRDADPRRRLRRRR